MAKKKRINKDLLFVLTAGAICFGLMACVVMFFPAVKLTYESILGTFENEIDGLHAVFGGAITAGNENFQFTITEFSFNVLAFIGYLLPLAAAVLGLLAFKSKSNLINYVAVVLCIVGAILIFLEPTLFVSVNEINEKYVASLLIGPVLGGIFALVSAAFHGGCGYMKK